MSDSISDSFSPTTPEAPPPARPQGPGAGREFIELLSSMRFAIALLTVICIASVIGTVVRQREPLNNYVNQFGPFWSEVFGKVDLYTVYSAWWFLLILGFLVVSTTLCIARNTPKILADLKSYKEQVREQSLQAHKHKALGQLPLSLEASLQQVSQWLDGGGWKARAQVRTNGIMIAARKGAANKIGYLAAHSAIVLICLGGLFDGDLLVKALMWAQGKSVYQGGGFISEVPAQHRLSDRNPSFRGTLTVTEGSRNGTAVLSMTDGVLLQPLPFDVELKKFKVEYYNTGMPKLFASDVLIHDRDGKTSAATIKVNEPLIHEGIAIYQSDFSDGGSLLKLRAIPLDGAEPFVLQGRVGTSTELQQGAQRLGLEFSGLRVINVENMGGNAGAPNAEGGTDVRKVDLVDSLQGHLGSGAKTRTEKSLQNIGPSFNYKLVDASGQRREFNNYMAPVLLDGQRVFLLGMRESLNEGFRYLRAPADENGSLDGWLRLRQALQKPELRERAARLYAEAATPTDKPQMLPQLTATAQRALGLFSGADTVRPDDKKPANGWGGLMALSQFVDREVPEAERSRVSEVLLRILNGSLYELLKISRAQAQLPPPANDAATQAFMTQAVLSLSDAVFYPAPLLLQLEDFQLVQASGFQVARAPGKTLVYLGAILLIIGVFAMLYIKERRLWIWLEAAPGQGEETRVRMALSSTRESPDTATEFDRLKSELLKDTA